MWSCWQVGPPLPNISGWKLEEEGALEASGPWSWGRQQRWGQGWSESRPRLIVNLVGRSQSVPLQPRAPEEGLVLPGRGVHACAPGAPAVW